MSKRQSNAFLTHGQQVLSSAVQQAEALVQSQQRRGKLTVQTLLVGCLMKRQATLSDFATLASHLGVRIHPSSLPDRLTTRLVIL